MLGSSSHYSLFSYRETRRCLCIVQLTCSVNLNSQSTLWRVCVCAHSPFMYIANMGMFSVYALLMGYVKQLSIDGWMLSFVAFFVCKQTCDCVFACQPCRFIHHIYVGCRSDVIFCLFFLFLSLSPPLLPPPHTLSLYYPPSPPPPLQHTHTLKHSLIVVYIIRVKPLTARNP